MTERSAREEMLARVRAARGEAPDPTGPPVVRREYRAAGAVPAGAPELIEVLAHRLEDYRATVHRVAEDEIASTVAAVLPDRGWRARLVVPPGLPGGWLPAGVDVLTDDGLDVHSLDAADGVLTGAAVAVAETGTIVLDGSPDQGRRVLTLLPALHICVLRPAQVVGTVPEAIARLSPTRPLTWISGPSATSDIELSRVEGVHGPRTLHVVIAAPGGHAAGRYTAEA